MTVYLLNPKQHFFDISPDISEDDNFVNFEFDEQETAIRYARDIIRNGLEYYDEDKEKLLFYPIIRIRKVDIYCSEDEVGDNIVHKLPR